MKLERLCQYTLHCLYSKIIPFHLLRRPGKNNTAPIPIVIVQISSFFAIYSLGVLPLLIVQYISWEAARHRQSSEWTTTKFPRVAANNYCCDMIAHQLLNGKVILTDYLASFICWALNCPFQICDLSLAKSSEIKVKVTHE